MMAAGAALVLAGALSRPALAQETVRVGSTPTRTRNFIDMNIRA
jgi:polar amino acid transport system substrate-binding protein